MVAPRGSLEKMVELLGIRVGCFEGFELGRMPPPDFFGGLLNFLEAVSHHTAGAAGIGAAELAEGRVVGAAVQIDDGMQERLPAGGDEVEAGAVELSSRHEDMQFGIRRIVGEFLGSQIIFVVAGVDVGAEDDIIGVDTVVLQPGGASVSQSYRFTAGVDAAKDHEGKGNTVVE